MRVPLGFMPLSIQSDRSTALPRLAACLGRIRRPNTDNLAKRQLVRLAVLAVFVLVLISPVMATKDMHYEGSGRQAPWGECTTCHGNALSGGIIAPSCMNCHEEFSGQGSIPVGHHAAGREDPSVNCAGCHGDDLMGGDEAPSCFACHDGLWPGSDLPPMAVAFGPSAGYVGIAVSFDGSSSLDLDGTIVSYDWDFGDGNTTAGASPTHTYAGEGIYTVTLTVTDDGGLTDTATTTVDVTISSNAPPTANLNGPYTGGAGSALLLDGSGSSDADGTIVLYEWDFGDGTTDTGVLAMHAYDAAGQYTVTLTVTDDAGFSDTATTTAQISDSGNLPPTVDAGGPYSGAPGQEIQFDASGSSDPEGDPLVSLWTFEGSAEPVIGLTASHSWSQPGTYTATVSVTDGANLPVVVDLQVEVSDNASPNPQGDSWLVTTPFGYWYDEFIVVTFEDFNGFQLVAMVYPDGQTSTGIGVESGDVVYWMDGDGTFYFGQIDHDAGAMSGVMWSNWSSSIWFAEPLP